MHSLSIWPRVNCLQTVTYNNIAKLLLESKKQEKDY